jgi:Putative beta-lactamase-inhibitor-like, PepSY-like
MKKTVFAMLMLVVCVTMSMAQKSATVKKVIAPELVMTSFKEKFTGDVVPSWTKTSTGNFTATVDQNGSKQYAEFSPEGKWISTSTMMPFEQLTEVAQKNVKEQYADMAVTEVKKIERDGMAAFYKLKLTKDKDSKTVYVNDAGFVKE